MATFGIFSKKTPPPPPGQLRSAELRYGQTTIFIKVVPNSPAPADFAILVAMHLDEIGRRFPNFFGTLAKRQLIAFEMVNSNSCRGGVNGYVKLRREHGAVILGGNGNRPAFAAELQQTMTRAGKNPDTLAQDLMAVILYDWQGGITPNPFSAVMAPGQAGIVAAKIRTWLAATAHPDDVEMDTLVLALERHLAPGQGADCRITYDPNYILGGRPAYVGLFHELVHAYYFSKGKNLGLCDSSNVAAGGRHFELMAVGMAPFDQRRFSENKMRALCGVPLRTVYP
jgi:hypothetical protein